MTTAEEVDAAYRPLIQHLHACPDCKTFPLCATGENLRHSWRQALGDGWLAMMGAPSCTTCSPNSHKPPNSTG